MEWDEDDLAKTLSWLEQSNIDRYARERRLDPFATSMRDFDDVSADLRRLRDEVKPNRPDPEQRIVDLRGAALADTVRTALTPLGQYTLAGWERNDVASSAKEDELARHLILLAEAFRADHPLYRSFYEYWSEIRDRYSPFDLIHNWDALYTLNYLDYPRKGYSPGNLFHENSVPIQEIEFDLDELAEDEDERGQATDGAKRIKRAIQGKIPRGRHRATFCSALEIMVGGEASLKIILHRFGVPNKPRIWSVLNDNRKMTIREIAENYHLFQSMDDVNIPNHVQPEIFEEEYPETEGMDEEGELILPENIDFDNALVRFQSGKGHRSSSERQKSAAKTSKIDHMRKAFINKRIGDLGEEFAILFERWRLRERPDLQKQIHHISKENDAAGYDILSFEEDGTCRFVEVKSTMGALNTPFFVSAREIETAEVKKEGYVILRVFDLKVSPKCCEIRFPFDNIIELSPSSFVATFC